MGFHRDSHHQRLDGCTAAPGDDLSRMGQIVLERLCFRVLPGVRPDPTRLLSRPIPRHPYPFRPDAALWQHHCFTTVPPLAELYAKRIPAFRTANGEAPGRVVTPQRERIPMFPAEPVAPGRVFSDHDRTPTGFELGRTEVAEAVPVPDDENVLWPGMFGCRELNLIAQRLETLRKRIPPVVQIVPQCQPSTHGYHLLGSTPENCPGCN